jgi:DNA-binding GntR family transcriptional regulator
MARRKDAPAPRPAATGDSGANGADSDGVPARLSLQGARVSLGDLTYTALREAYVHGTLVPGQVISEEQLAADLGVSRPVVRESIQRMSAEGLLERASNGRLYVKSVSAEEIRALYSVRSALEQLAVEEAIGKLTPEDIALLKSNLRRMRLAEQTRTEDVAESGGDFHATIVSLAQNPINARLLDMLKVLIDRYRYLSTGHTVTRPQESVREHEEILRHIEKGDTEAARSAVARHTQAAKESALTALTKIEQGAESSRSAATAS